MVPQGRVKPPPVIVRFDDFMVEESYRVADSWWDEVRSEVSVIGEESMPVGAVGKIALARSLRLPLDSVRRGTHKDRTDHVVNGRRVVIHTARPAARRTACLEVDLWKDGWLADDYIAALYFYTGNNQREVWLKGIISREEMLRLLAENYERYTRPKPQPNARSDRITRIPHAKLSPLDRSIYRDWPE